MNLLIIGGAGFIGCVLTNEFLKNGHSVRVLDIFRRGSDGILRFKNNKDFELINSDYTTEILRLSLIDIDIVIHLAAIVEDNTCDQNKNLATYTNVTGVKHLIDECNKKNIDKLFFTSTCSIYGNNSKTCTEETKPKPLSHYAITKLEAERILKIYSKISALSFRLGTLYGWSSNMRFDLIVNHLVKDAVLTSKFNIFDGIQYRPFLHPKDLAYFFMSIFDEDLDRYNGEVFNLVSENLSMLELGQLIERIIPYSNMNLISEKEGNESYICRSFKAYNELGWSPLIRVRDGIQEIEKKIIKAREMANIYKFIDKNNR